MKRKCQTNGVCVCVCACARARVWFCEVCSLGSCQSNHCATISSVKEIYQKNNMAFCFLLDIWDSFFFFFFYLLADPYPFLMKLHQAAVLGKFASRQENKWWTGTRVVRNKNKTNCHILVIISHNGSFSLSVESMSLMFCFSFNTPEKEIFDHYRGFMPSQSSRDLRTRVNVTLLKHLEALGYQSSVLNSQLSEILILHFTTFNLWLPIFTSNHETGQVLLKCRWRLFSKCTRCHFG